MVRVSCDESWEGLLQGDVLCAMFIMIAAVTVLCFYNKIQLEIQLEILKD